MKKCINHPDINSSMVCHGCGKYYCEHCLLEVNEYHFCNNDECKKLMQTELEKTAPISIECPQCYAELKLTKHERKTGIVHCNECEAIIDITKNPPNLIYPKEYTELFSTINQGDLEIIKTLLDEADIDYYVFGENFLSIDPVIHPSKFYIATVNVETVKELLKDFQLKNFGLSINEKRRYG